MIKSLFRSPQALTGLALIVVMLFVALLAPVLAPHDPELVDMTKKFSSPNAEYPLGTDQLGRCELSRLLYGARYSLAISLPILCVLAIIGVALGTLSVCAGEKLDRVLTIVCDIFISFPSLIIAVAVIGVLGNGLQNIAIAVVTSTWAWFTRMVRSYALVEPEFLIYPGLLILITAAGFNHFGEALRDVLLPGEEELGTKRGTMRFVQTRRL